jgi:protein SHQ1
MITPPFQVQQDEDFVYVTMKVKYIKAKECEFYINEEEFKFFCKPYLLKLTFPYAVVEDGRERATYDIENGELKVWLPKKQRGQFFPNLDMITELLGIKSKTTPQPSQQMGKPLIEEMDFVSSALRKENEEEEIDWSIPPTLPAEEVSMDASTLLNRVKYGFNNEFYDFFKYLQEDLSDIIDNPQPETLTPKERRQQRIESENRKFNDDYYITDFILDEEIQSLLKFTTIWERQLKKKKELIKKMKALSITPTNPITSITTNNTNSDDAPVLKPQPQPQQQQQPQSPPPPPQSQQQQPQPQQPQQPQPQPQPQSQPQPQPQPQSQQQQQQPQQQQQSRMPSNCDPSSRIVSVPIGDFAQQQVDEEIIPFTETEQNILMQLKKRIYMLDNERATLLGLLDILYAFAYDHRTTMGEPTVESAWTIAKLSSTLSWFDKFETPQEVLIACVRRALCFPLYRHYKLAVKIIDDVKAILKLGKRAVLKCFLNIKYLFDRSDNRHYLSRLYIDHYCVWIQSLSRKKLHALLEGVKNVKLSKNDIGFDLDALEELAKQEEATIRKMNPE